MFKPTNLFKSKSVPPNINEEQKVIEWFLQNDEKTYDLRTNFSFQINITMDTILKILNDNPDASSLISQFLLLYKDYHEKALPNTFPIIRKYGNKLPTDRNELKLLGAESMMAAILRILGYFLGKKYGVNTLELTKQFNNAKNKISIRPDYYEKKVVLIKNLAKKRINEDINAAVMGINPDDVDYITDDMILGLPEATIITVVENFIQHKLTNQYPNEEIFKIIEEERAAYDDYRSELPIPLNLFNYIKYRLEKEQSEVGKTWSENDDFLRYAIDEAKKLCNENFL